MRLARLCSFAAPVLLAGGMLAAGCVGDDPVGSPGSSGDAGGGGEAGQDSALVDSTNNEPTDSGAKPDPDAAGGACDVAAPFTKVEIVAGLSHVATEDAPRLTPDERTIYFMSERPGGPGTASLENIWKSTRPDKGSPFPAPSPLVGVNTDFVEAAPFPSRDGVHLYFNSNLNGNAGSIDLWRVRLDSLGDRVRLGPAAGPGVDSVASSANDFHPMLAEDGALYFASARSGNSDIYSAPGPFAAAAPLAEVNTTAHDMFPTVSKDGLVLYWASTRTDLGAPLGSHDIFVATRTTTTALFAGARRVAEVNGSDADYPGWLSDDRCRLYFAKGGELHIASKIQ